MAADVKVLKNAYLSSEGVLLNPWQTIIEQSSSSSSSAAVKKGERLVSVMRFHGYGADDEAACMISGVTTSLVTGRGVGDAHIWPRHTRGLGLERFGLALADWNSPRNALLLVKPVEKAFDLLQAAFVFDESRNVLSFRIFDPELKGDEKCAYTLKEGGPVTFSSLEGKALVVPDTASFPFRRLLAWHLSQVLERARQLHWLTDTDAAAFLPGRAKVISWLATNSPGFAPISWPGQAGAGAALIGAAARGSVDGGSNKS